MLVLVLAIISLISSALISGWLFRSKRSGATLAAGAFAAAAVLQAFMIMIRWHGAEVPPMLDGMWSAVILGFSISYVTLIKQLERPFNGK